jgi:hypothetical protein
MQAVLELDCFPAGMELFPAADDSAWEYIEKIIQESDYYIVIVGARYGSRDGNGLSFTEREYDLAAKLQKPILAFLHSEPQSIAISKADLNEADRVALDAFREKLRQSKLCNHWSSALELYGKVLSSLNRLKRSHPTGGWVRAGEVPAAELELELERTRLQLSKMTAELKDLKDKAEKSARSELLPPAKGWGELTSLQVDYESGHSTSRKTVRVKWEAVFKYIGPRMAECALSPTSIRTRLSKLCAESAEIRQEQKPTISQAAADKVVWQLQALGMIEMESAGWDRRWKLTDEGWKELDRLIVEEKAT